MCASIPLAALVVEFHIYSRRAPLLDFHARDGVVAGSVFAGYDQLPRFQREVQKYCMQYRGE